MVKFHCIDYEYEHYLKVTQWSWRAETDGTEHERSNGRKMCTFRDHLSCLITATLSTICKTHQSKRVGQGESIRLNIKLRHKYSDNTKGSKHNQCACVDLCTASQRLRNIRNTSDMTQVIHTSPDS